MSTAYDIIRHPVDIPLEVKAVLAADDQADRKQAVCGQLSFHFPMMIAVGVLLSICIPSINAQEKLKGQVTSISQSGHGFMIAMSFQSETEAFRMRMLEQLCQIEDYRQHALDHEGRQLNQEQAALEWIDHYAATFPVLV
ncbi:MAG: hypothetical protein Q9M17_04080 [Mariprofundus sp.]|nr:hypothetical protein [Mariprofundus sp.]